MKIVEKIDAIYTEIPKLNCQGKFHESCGPILCSVPEFERMKASSLLPLVKLNGMDCPALNNGSCTVYAVRPLICRLWGAVKAMMCPYGCVPERWMSEAEATRLIRRVRKLTGGAIDGPAMNLVKLTQGSVL